MRNGQPVSFATVAISYCLEFCLFLSWSVLNLIKLIKFPIPVVQTFLVIYKTAQEIGTGKNFPKLNALYLQKNQLQYTFNNYNF